MFSKKTDWRIILAIGLGTMMTSFDGSAVGAILPVITHAFHSNVQAGKWIVTLYLLTISSLLLLAGRLGDIFGYRRLYLTGLCISITGALFCALANSIAMLASCRVIEGIGVVSVLANGIPILTKSHESNKLGFLLGLVTTMAYAGLIAGSALSGWLSQAYGWRSIFFIVMLIAVVSFSLGVYVLPRDQPPAKFTGHDFPKTAIIFNRSMIAPTTAAMLCYVSLYCTTFILPFYLLDGQGINPVKIGFILGIRPAATAVFTPVSGALADLYGARRMSILGLLLLAGAFLWFARITNGLPEPITIVLLLGGIGIGMGVFLAPNHAFIINTAPINYKGVASAALALARNLGMLAGASLGGALLTTTPGNLANARTSINIAAHSAFWVSTFLVVIGVIILFVSSISYFALLIRRGPKKISAQLPSQ